MKKSLRWGLGCCAFAFSLALVAWFCFIRQQIMIPGSGMPYSERSIIMSDDIKTVSIILRELSMEQTGRKDKWAFWPHESELDATPNSTAFLRRRQREPPIETLFPSIFDDMPTYPHSPASERCFFKETGESRWTFLVGPSENTPGFVPLILSGGIDVSVLCDLLAGKQQPARKASLLKNRDEWGMLHFKDWKVVFLDNRSFEIKRRERTMESFGVMSPPYIATYLTPTGLVTVTFRSP